MASGSSFYRVLHEQNQQHKRGRSQTSARKVATTHTTTGPNQLWCWDITWLPGPVKRLFYYFYQILGIYSCKLVGWEIYDNESENASELVRKNTYVNRLDLNLWCCTPATSLPYK